MNSTRCVTPPKVNTSFVFTLNEKLNNNEFPVYNSDGNRNCPPAPPNYRKEIRICEYCKYTYQIANKTDPVTKCGNCS